MAILNYVKREIVAKIVYYGPGLSGKTTNIQKIHEELPQSVGELVSLATESDRTLFFDYVPVDVGKISGLDVRFQLFTVPGQVFYNQTRRRVLEDADGIVFVADSQKEQLDANLESLDNLEENLGFYERALAEVPFVLQLNKQDLPNIDTVERLTQLLGRHDAPVILASCVEGYGVTETLAKITTRVIDHLREQMTKKGAGSIKRTYSKEGVSSESVVKNLLGKIADEAKGAPLAAGSAKPAAATAVPAKPAAATAAPAKPAAATAVPAMPAAATAAPAKPAAATAVPAKPAAATAAPAKPSAASAVPGKPPPPPAPPKPAVASTTPAKPAVASAAPARPAAAAPVPAKAAGLSSPPPPPAPPAATAAPAGAPVPAAKAPARVGVPPKVGPPAAVSPPAPAAAPSAPAPLTVPSFPGAPRSGTRPATPVKAPESTPSLPAAVAPAPVGVDLPPPAAAVLTPEDLLRSVDPPAESKPALGTRPAGLPRAPSRATRAGLRPAAPAAPPSTAPPTGASPDGGGPPATKLPDAKPASAPPTPPADSPRAQVPAPPFGGPASKPKPKPAAAPPIPAPAPRTPRKSGLQPIAAAAAAREPGAEPSVSKTAEELLRSMEGEEVPESFSSLGGGSFWEDDPAAKGEAGDPDGGSIADGFEDAKLLPEGAGASAGEGDAATPASASRKKGRSGPPPAPDGAAARLTVASVGRAGVSNGAVTFDVLLEEPAADGEPRRVPVTLALDLKQLDGLLPPTSSRSGAWGLILGLVNLFALAALAYIEWAARAP